MPGLTASGLKTQIKSYTETDSNVFNRRCFRKYYFKRTV